MIHPGSNSDQIPDCASLICSNAGHPMKRNSKKSAQEKYVNQCVKDKVPFQDETSKWEYKGNVYIEGDKNCQEPPNVHMQPVQPAKKKIMLYAVKAKMSKTTV